MAKKFKCIHLLTLSVLVFFSLINFTQATEPEPPKKGIAYGTFMVQGYSSLDSPGTLRFYAPGAQAEESSLSYVDDAYISLDNGDRDGKPYELKGTFSGGPSGVANFVTQEGLAFNIPLKNGRTFDLEIPGVQVHMTVADPTIFDIAEEDIPPEYDPNAPLTDSGVRAADISGQVEIACPPDFEAWDVLKMGRVIYNHCKLKTGEDSTLKISFIGGASFTMKPETEIAINEAKKEKTTVQLLFGSIWANVKKMAKGEEFGIKGSQAVAGIKGTTFIMEETGENTTLKVVEGEVEFTDTSDGKAQAVKTGEALSSDLRGFSEKTTFDATINETSWLAPGIADNKNTQVKEKEKSGKSGIVLATVIALAIIIGVAWVVKRKRSKI